MAPTNSVAEQVNGTPPAMGEIDPFKTNKAPTMACTKDNRVPQTSGLIPNDYQDNIGPLPEAKQQTSRPALEQNRGQRLSPVARPLPAGGKPRQSPEVISGLSKQGNNHRAADPWKPVIEKFDKTNLPVDKQEFDADMKKYGFKGLSASRWA